MLFGESFVYAFSLSLRILIHHGLHPSLLGCLVGLGEGGYWGFFDCTDEKGNPNHSLSAERGCHAKGSECSSAGWAEEHYIQLQG